LSFQFVSELIHLAEDYSSALALQLVTFNDFRQCIKRVPFVDAVVDWTLNELFELILLNSQDLHNVEIRVSLVHDTNVDLISEILFKGVLDEIFVFGHVVYDHS
jgi:hypothetical protein